MPKTIPAALLAHKAQQVTTICRLLKVICKDGTQFGFANLDIDVSYNDLLDANSPGSALLYRSANGFIPARMQNVAGTSVDNSDMAGLVSEASSLGITEAEIRSGKLDFADAWVYEVNYEDLTPGRHEIIARGNCGRVSMAEDGFRAEFRSLTQRLKQTIGEVTSITCRAQFGDARCGKTRTWTNATVTSVSGTEPDRIFTCSGLAGATDFYVPGVVEILSGDHTGLQVEVEAFSSGGIITLMFPLYFPAFVGMLIRISQDCTKDFDDDAHGCLYHWSTDRTLHFRGEPKLPLGQEGALGTPGAEI